MKIEFNNEDELVSGIITSDVNLNAVLSYLLDYCGVRLSKTNLDAIANREYRTRNARAKLTEWKEGGVTVYTDHDIPVWIREIVESNPMVTTFSYAVNRIIADIQPFAPMAQNFVKVGKANYYNQEGLSFLISRFCATHLISHEDWERWRRESGLFDFLYNREQTKEVPFWEK